MVRSVVGVVVGYLVFGASAAMLFALNGQDPNIVPGTGFLAASVVYGVAFAILGGFLAAVIAGRKEVVHAGIVAAIIATIALVSLLAKFGKSSIWSEVSVLVLMAPAALFGGNLRSRRKYA